MYTLGESDFEHQLPKQFQSVPVTFNHINQVVRCRPRLADCDICIVYSVLAAYCLDFFVVYVRQWYCVRYS